MRKPEVWFILAVVVVVALDWMGRYWALNHLANPRIGHPLVVVVDQPGTVETNLQRRFGSPSLIDASTTRNLDGRPFAHNEVLDSGQKILVPIREVPFYGVSLRLIFNKGATFGLQLGGFWDTVLRGLLGLFGAWICFRALQHTRQARRLMTAAMGVMWGGVIGNLISRMQYGYVVDFIALDLIPHWPVFNIADIALTLGTTGVLAIVFSQLKTKSLPQAFED